MLSGTDSILFQSLADRITLSDQQDEKKNIMYFALLFLILIYLLFSDFIFYHLFILFYFLIYFLWKDSDVKCLAMVPFIPEAPEESTPPSAKIFV